MVDSKKKQAFNGLSTFVLQRTAKRDGVRYKRGVKHEKKVTNVSRNVLAGGADEARTSYKFNDFMPLYDMWKTYMTTACGTWTNMKEKETLLRVDMHGAYVLVTASDNHCHIGTHGIVLRESRHTFAIITPDDRVIVLPKQSLQLTFALNEHVFDIYGDAFANVTPLNRVNRKFKHQQLKTLID